jgi:hypothetical protein
MKSNIRDVVIIPTGLLLDRKLKYFVRGFGWYDSLERTDRAATALLTLNVEAVLDPNYAFHGEVRYITSKYAGKAQVGLRLTHGFSRVKLAPLILYKKDCY